MEDPGLVGLMRETVARIDQAIDRYDVAADQSADRHDGGELAGVSVAAHGDHLPRAVRLLLRIEAALVHFASR